MSESLLFSLLLENVALLLSLLVIWSYAKRRKEYYQKKIDAALSTHLDTLLTAQLEQVQTGLKKISHIAFKNAEGLLHDNHLRVTTQSQELVTQFTTSLTAQAATLIEEQETEITDLFTQKSTQVTQELEKYRAQKMSELDQASDKLLAKVLERKVWHLMQSADAHTLAKAALQEVIASGELSV